jgi:peptidoglycan/LPS O-acetylase OafA/YrhL
LLGGAVFFIDHLFSFIYNRKRDEKKMRNIGTLWIAPFARILPMHLVLVMYGVVLSGRLYYLEDRQFPGV